MCERVCYFSKINTSPALTACAKYSRDHILGRMYGDTSVNLSQENKYVVSIRNVVQLSIERSNPILLAALTYFGANMYNNNFNNNVEMRPTNKRNTETCDDII